MNVKTYENWQSNQSLSEYLKVGDYVDDMIVEHFVNVLPPATLNGSMIQIGSAHSHIGGRATFPTLVKVDGYWRYAGNCFRGENINRG